METAVSAANNNLRAPAAYITGGRAVTLRYTEIQLARLGCFDKSA